MKTEVSPVIVGIVLFVVVLLAAVWGYRTLAPTRHSGAPTSGKRAGASSGGMATPSSGGMANPAAGGRVPGWGPAPSSGGR